MNTKNLQIYISVYKHNSITRAAEEMFMTQPAVTRAIKELEEDYGTTFFDRINKRLYITEAGKRFYDHAVHILDAYDQMEKEIRNWNDIGLLRVGASVTIGSCLLPKIIKEFQLQYPKMKIQAIVNNGNRLQEMLMNNEIDLALIEGTTASENLISKNFTNDRLVLVTHPENPLANQQEITINKIVTQPLLLRDKESISRNLIDHIFALEDIPINPIMESTSTHALLAAVKANLGVTIIPELMISENVDPDYITIKEINDARFTRNNYIVWHKDKYLTTSAQYFINLCTTVK